MRSRVAVLASALAVFSALPTIAAITHTTTNLNLRAGPGTHHRVKAIIPAGAPIDIESCGDTWCYMAWAGHVGYVKHQYLMHHVTEEVRAARSRDSCPQAWSDQLLAYGDGSERRKGNAMSRWLWALLAGVVARRDRSGLLDSSTRRASFPRSRRSQQLTLQRPSSTNARRRPLPPCRAGSRAVTCGAGRAAGRNPARPRAAPCPGAPRLRPSCRLLPLRSLPLRVRRRMQDSKPPRRPLSTGRALSTPRLRPSSRRSLRPRLLRLRRSPNRPAAARARTGGRSGSRERIRAQEPRAAGRDLGLFRGGLRAALPAARRPLGLSGAGGQVRPGRDCRVAEENPSPFRHLPD